MTRIRWAQYNHRGMFHDSVNNELTQFQSTHTACGIPLSGFVRGLTADEDYMAYTGRGTATSCKRCLKIRRTNK